MRNKALKNLVFAAVFLALAYVLPFLTGQIPEIGSKLCPMHLPVLLCGFVCGPVYGLAVGLIAPILRSLTLSMPPLFPTAVAMCFELGAYGLFAGLFYKAFPKKVGYIYISLILAMLLGRLVWGAAMYVLAAIGSKQFGLAAFWTSGFVNALPGIILQIVVIPPIVLALKKAKLMD
ncbi:MAG: ECF transporter S component [Clostridiales bacterium]|nr:ECF transporter S component [Clostridiales bacterium]